MLSAFYPFAHYFFSASIILYVLGAAFSFVFRGDAGRFAAGSCAFDGGIFGDTYATTGGAAKVIPVNAYIPGCPPRPQALIYGLLTALGRLEGKR